MTLPGYACGRVGKLYYCYSEGHRTHSLFSVVGSGRRSIVAATNGSQCVSGWNPPLMVVLSLRNGEVMRRGDYATYNVGFVAAIAE